MKMKLADALLLRKEHAAKVAQLATINKTDLHQTIIERKPIDQSMDSIIAKVAKLSASQVTHEYDWHARQLRMVDGVIQRANWDTEVEVPESVNEQYTPPAAVTK